MLSRREANRAWPLEPLRKDEVDCMLSVLSFVSCFLFLLVSTDCAESEKGQFARELLDPAIKYQYQLLSFILRPQLCFTTGSRRVKESVLDMDIYGFSKTRFPCAWVFITSQGHFHDRRPLFEAIVQLCLHQPIYLFKDGSNDARARDQDWGHAVPALGGESRACQRWKVPLQRRQHGHLGRP